MKFIILCSLIALAIAAPREDYKPLSSTSTLDSNKPTLASDPKAKAPISNPAVINKPLTKRDAPTKNDQKNTNTPINNAQKKPVAPSPIASDASKTPSNARPSRDTVKTPVSNTPQVNQQKNSAPAAPAKTSTNARPSRDTPKAPLTNAQYPSTPQKEAAPVPSTVQKTQSNSRNRRDTQTQQNSYKPQASGVPQKTNSPPSPVASSDSQKTSSNARPSRDTVKTPVSNTPQVNQQKSPAAPAVDSTKTSSNKRPSRETPKTPLTNAQTPSKPLKEAAPVPSTVQKTQQNSRNRRDTPVKPTEINQKPVEWNKNEKKVDTPQPSTTVNRKTRETPKTNTNTHLKDDKIKTGSTVQHPEVAKVPLTSTNARNRRDAPNPAEQSKLVPSGSISGKQNVAPALQARDSPPKTSATNAGNKRDTEKLGIRQPLPVDQIVKQKTPSNANPASDNLKPVENVNKKV